MASLAVMMKIIKKFDEQKECDVFFKVPDGQLGAHKIILSLQSFPLYEENKDQPIIQVDIDYGTLRSIIRFLYTEEICINKANVIPMMHASCLLKIPFMEDQCSTYLAEIVTNQNFVHLLNIATDFKSTMLQKILLKFFKGPNMTTIIHDVNFKRLTPEGIALLLTVPPSGDNGATELDFFIALRRWARFECQRQGIRLASGHQIRQVFGENFKYLGVPYMRLEDVSRLVIGKGILEKDEELSLLHFMSLPLSLRDIIKVQFPFNCQGHRASAFSKADKTNIVDIGKKHCASCRLKLDCYYGAEMIHCIECDIDICFDCQSKPDHQNHRKSLYIKTVLNESRQCCQTCGWPAESENHPEGRPEAFVQDKPPNTMNGQNSCYLSSGQSDYEDQFMEDEIEKTCKNCNYLPLNRDVPKSRHSITLGDFIKKQPKMPRQKGKKSATKPQI